MDKSWKSFSPLVVLLRVFRRLGLLSIGSWLQQGRVLRKTLGFAKSGVAMLVAVLLAIAILIPAPPVAVKTDTGSGGEGTSYVPATGIPLNLGIGSGSSSDSTATFSLCSGSLSNSTTDSDWASRPVIVNIQIDLESEGDQEYVYDILNEIEACSWRATVFVSGEFATRHPNIVRDIQDRGHQVAVHGWQRGEDLTLLSYAEQLSLIDRAFAAVKSTVSKPEEVVDFKPQGYRFNNDTIKIAQELGAKSVSGVFACEEPFCKCPYAKKLGKITFPYPVNNHFWLVPISEVKIDASNTPLDDEYIDNPQEFLNYLVETYDERDKTKDPLIVVVHPSGMHPVLSGELNKV